MISDVDNCRGFGSYPTRLEDKRSKTVKREVRKLCSISWRSVFNEFNIEIAH